jgi:hypothetical protein
VCILYSYKSPCLYMRCSKHACSDTEAILSTPFCLFERERGPKYPAQRANLFGYAIAVTHTQDAIPKQAHFTIQAHREDLPWRPCLPGRASPAQPMYRRHVSPPSYVLRLAGGSTVQRRGGEPRARGAG